MAGEVEEGCERNLYRIALLLNAFARFSNVGFEEVGFDR